jgi:hypothetical protein
MGKLTATRRKPPCSGILSRETVKDCWPQQGICRPSAPARLGPDGADSDCQGMMVKAEPVSNKNQWFEALSVTQNSLPGHTAKITPWPPSFPSTGSPPRSSRPARRTSIDRSTWTSSGHPARSGGDEERPATAPGSSVAAEDTGQWYDFGCQYYLHKTIGISAYGLSERIF